MPGAGGRVIAGCYRVVPDAGYFISADLFLPAALFPAPRGLEARGARQLGGFHEHVNPEQATEVMVALVKQDPSKRRIVVSAFERVPCCEALARAKE